MNQKLMCTIYKGLKTEIPYFLQGLEINMDKSNNFTKMTELTTPHPWRPAAIFSLLASILQQPVSSRFVLKPDKNTPFQGHWQKSKR